MKTKNPQSKSRRNPPSQPAPRLFTQPRNSARYRWENGQHLITLGLGEGAFTVLRLVALRNEESPENYVLRGVCEVAASHLAAISDEDAEKLIESGVLEHPALANEPASEPVHEIVLHVTERAYTILQGQAAKEEHNSVAEMIGYDAASLFAQDSELKESEARKMFFLKP
jgi:hypothetical protein